MPEVEKVPGNNNTTYCSVPRSEQLFQIEFFEIAPLPVPVDQIFFTLLRGYIPPNITGLDTAKFSITLSADLASGEHEPPRTYTIPLDTFSREAPAHLLIRYENGSFGGPLKAGVMNDIVTDYWIPGMFLKTGTWSFKAEGFISKQREEEKDRYLFAFEMTQWLEGDMK